MHTIKKRFDDYSRPNNKGFLRLEPNQPISLYGQVWPIVWSGSLNGTEVSVIQKPSSSSDSSNYELRRFPKGYEWSIDDTVDLIDIGVTHLTEERGSDRLDTPGWRLE